MAIPEVVLTVDRRGPRGTVIVQDEQEHEATLPVSWFSCPPAEGDVFRLTLVADETLRDRRRAEVAALASALDEGTGTDDIETL
jgi:hypothetical protein